MSDDNTPSPTVVPLRPGTAPNLGRVVNPRLVDMLERALEMARAGEIQGMATVLHYHDGAAATWTAGVVGGFTMVGAAAVMHFDLMRIANSDRDAV